MKFNDYINKIGLKSFKNGSEKPDGVYKYLKRFKTNFSHTEIKKLYTYDVPAISDDGACSILDKKADKPYNLAETYGLDFNSKTLTKDPNTLRLWRLNGIIEKLYKDTGSGWLGVYRSFRRGKDKFLLKEAYRGLRSRAEFPLTKEFAKKSNNSTVGVSGKAGLIQDIIKHNGPYYVCDTKVQSEFCIPILNKKGSVIGIIDIESPKKGFFTQKRLLQISKVAYDLGQSNLLLHI